MAQKAAKMKHLIAILQGLKNVVLLSHRLTTLETEVKALQEQIATLKNQQHATGHDLDRRLLRIEHFVEFVNHFRLLR